MKTGRGSIRDVVVVSCKKGEDLLECLEKAVEKYDIEHGLILTGYGTLDKSNTHMVTTTGFPVHEHFEKMEQALEVISLDGIISSGDIHAHIVLSDTEQAYGGHLEPGCRTLYLCEVVIGILDNIKLSRETDENGLNLLDIEELN
ncbi:MAG: PPC domain-containing DNA-binding protein [Halothermotrichaceae bacterium]